LVVLMKWMKWMDCGCRRRQACRGVWVLHGLLLLLPLLRVLLLMLWVLRWWSSEHCHLAGVAC